MSTHVRGFIGFVILIVLLCLLQNAKATEGKSSEAQLKKEKLQLEQDEKAVKYHREKFCRNQAKVLKHQKFKRICDEFNHHYLVFFFSLFAIIAIGATVRTLLKVYQLNIPYTVILMLLGVAIGFGTWNSGLCVHWSIYTKIARTNPKIILYVFLPVLIFESAFAMKAHVFYRSALSIMILALPGMVICTFLTAFICQQFFYAYKWDFMVASLFGSIISATDPVAVVAILKEIGTSEMLSIMIEGESLLNDGTAILFYEIFNDVVLHEYGIEEGETGGGGRIFGKFCQIAIGGPAFGWLMGKISVFFLSRIFNDAAVEVSITVVAAYLTYYLSEAVLGVSGVMAVVTMGIILSAERTCISPEVQGLVHHFWEMLGYLGNTVLFLMVGILISETAINNVTLEDGYYLVLLYFTLNISRFIMIVVVSPILSNVGYGLSWQNLLVMTWSGLRGGVGLCLSLIVYKDRGLCDKLNIGPKFLLQTAGIVLMTLLINGTTTKLLLDTLKLTELSIGKIQDMNNAVKQVQAAQERTIAALRHDRLLADCNFDMVQGFTNIDNPYTKFKVKAKKKATEDDYKASPSLLIDSGEKRVAICPDCNEEVPAEPTVDEYRDMTEEARLRLLKALKVSVWRQFEQGVLTEEAAQIIVSYCENCEDRHFKTFHADDLKKFWAVRGFAAYLRNKIANCMAQYDQDYSPPQPDAPWRKAIYRMVMNDWYDAFMNIMVVLNMIPILWETVLIIKGHDFTDQETTGFLVTDIVFTAILAIDFSLKLLAFGCMEFWSSKWNILDSIVLIISVVEVSLSISYLTKTKEERSDSSADTEFLKFLRFVRVLRVIRILRLFRPLVPRIMNYLNSRVNRTLFFGYDVAKGSATAIDDVLKFLPQMIDNRKVLLRFKTVLEDQRLIFLLEMGLLQKDHPGIAIAVKTRHANRAILNEMRSDLNGLKEDGLIDDKEFDILLHDIESKMKGLWNSPSYMTPRRPEMVLADLQWIGGNTELLSYLLRYATALQFAVGDILFSPGDDPNGIYVIVSGVVKVRYEPSYDLIKTREATGEIPNSDIFAEPTFEEVITDYLSTGCVLGELSVLTGAARASAATCETGVLIYHVNQAAMRNAIEAFDDHYDSLEGRLWRSFGLKLAAAILPYDQAFESWTIDRIKNHLESSAVPIGQQYLSLAVPNFISDVVLVYGQVVNWDNPDEMFTAPCLIPSTVSKVRKIDNFIIRPRLLVIATENAETTESEGDSADAPDSETTVDVHKFMMTTAIKPANIDQQQVMNLHLPSLSTVDGSTTLRSRSTAVPDAPDAAATTSSRPVTKVNSRQGGGGSGPPPPPPGGGGSSGGDQ